MFLLLAALACTPNSTEPETDHTGTVPAPDTTRVVLHEAFSGSNCGPCAPAAENLSAALSEAEGRYAMVKYQIGSDPYISSEAVGRRMLYLPGESSYAIPYVHADGTNGFHPNEMEDGAPYDATDFEVLSAVDSVLAVDVSMEVVDQTVNTTVELHPTGDIEGENLRLMVAIIENTTTLNVGSNGQTEFHSVFKKFVPDADGTPLEPLTAGTPISFELEYAFQGEYATEAGYSNPVDHTSEHTVEEFEDLAVVAWVQDMDTWTVHNTGFDGIH